MKIFKRNLKIKISHQIGKFLSVLTIPVIITCTMGERNNPADPGNPNNTIPKYTLTTTIQPAAGGSISLSPSGRTYDSGTVVKLTATRSSGYDFSSWSGSVTGTSTSVNVTMNANKNVTANFAARILPKYTLTTAVQPTAGGSVSLSPPGGTYDSGTVVTITATRSSGYDFSSWSGSATGTSTLVSVTMTENKNVTANFVKVTGPIGTCVIRYVVSNVQYQFTVIINGNTGNATGGRCDNVNCYNEANFQLRDFGESSEGYFYNMVPLTSGWTDGTLYLERGASGWYFTKACNLLGCFPITVYIP